jgi:ADP-heptose:LPS heptosyltransferase
MSQPERYLFIRLGAIGDILLTTPLIRSLRRAKPEAEIHYLVKPQYRTVLATNPHIDHLHVLEGSLWHVAQTLRPFRFTHILDLHKNLRSHILRAFLQRPASTFDKRNALKSLMTRLPGRPRPHVQVDHLVPRYAQALDPLGVQLDDGGLDYPLVQADGDLAENWLREQGWQTDSLKPVGLVLGATWAPKRWFPGLLIPL